MDIKISVVIPVYNTGKYLRECLDSVINQTLEGIEIICVNDGSTDNSSDILGEYEKSHGVIVVNQDNQGAGSARNKGICMASGKYIAFADPDDYYANNNALETLYRNAEREGAMICGGDVITQHGEYRQKFDRTGEILFNDLKMAGNHQGYIFRLDFLKNNGILYPSYRRYQDPPFLLDVMATAGKFLAVNTDVYIYRVNYKNIKFDSNVAVNVLNGINDMFVTVSRHGFDASIPIRELNGYLDKLMVQICMDNLEVNEALARLNSTLKDTAREEYVITEEMVSEFKDDCEVIYNGIRDNVPMIVYGAGKIGSRAVEVLNGIGANILGIAVSDLDGNPNSLSGYSVREIGDYVKNFENAVVVISVGKPNVKDIKDNLVKLGFENIHVWTENKMEFIREYFLKKGVWKGSFD